MKDLILGLGLSFLLAGFLMAMFLLMGYAGQNLINA